MNTPLVFIVVRKEGDSCEPWKACDDVTVAHEWAEYYRRDAEPGVEYGVYHLALFSSPPPLDGRTVDRVE